MKNNLAYPESVVGVKPTSVISQTHIRQFHRHFKKPLSHNQRLTFEKADFPCKRSA
jgi:hypothetical protein